MVRAYGGKKQRVEVTSGDDRTWSAKSEEKAHKQRQKMLRPKTPYKTMTNMDSGMATKRHSEQQCVLEQQRKKKFLYATD